MQTVLAQKKCILLVLLVWLHLQKFHTKLSYICVSKLQSADKSNFPVRCLETGVGLQSCLGGLFFHFSASLFLSLFSFFLYFSGTENYFCSVCLCFINSYSLSQIYYTVWAGIFVLSKQMHSRVDHFSLTAQNEIFSAVTAVERCGKPYLYVLVCKPVPQPCPCF